MPPRTLRAIGFLTAICIAAFWAANAPAEEVLRTIAGIRALSPESAERSIPVEIEGVVTYYNSPESELLLHDGHDGIYVQLPEKPDYYPHFQTGDQIRIQGIARPGEFLPMIRTSSITVLGQGRRPEAHRIVEGELFSPALSCQWVEAPGVVVGAEKRENAFTLTVEVSGRPLLVKMPWADDAPARAARLMQRPVTIRGTAGTIFNKQRQLTGRFFFVESFDDIVPSEAGAPFLPAPLRTVEELLRYGETSQSRVRVQGIVTEAGGGVIYLRGKGGSLPVHWSAAGGFAPGTRVEAEGFAAVASFRPELRATRVKEIEQAAPPAPLPLDLANDRLGLQHAELVTVDAEFLALREAAPGRVVLQCRARNWFFDAFLPDGSAPPRGLLLGSTLRLTGICELINTHLLPPESVDGFRLHLRERDGIVVLHSAPWWTLQRVSWALEILSALALAALAWIALLRRRVAEQTKTISAQIERAVVNEERQRIARELHDTLEQDLAGTSAQLRNARRRLAIAPGQAGDSIELAERMLDHCREEARTSIRDLRSITLEQRGLHGALEEFLAPVAQECGARFHLEVHGEPRTLPGPTGVHLLRIAQQAVANAAQHGNPSAIHVRLDCTADAVRLEIQDDGAGFDPLEPAPRGHFGILGMRERANKLRAELEIASTPGGGSCIRLTAPLADSPTLQTCPA